MDDDISVRLELRLRQLEQRVSAISDMLGEMIKLSMRQAAARYREAHGGAREAAGESSGEGVG